MSFFTKDFQWLAYAGTIIGTIIGFWVVGLLLKKRKEKSSQVLTYLTGAVTFMSLAVFVDLLFFTIGGLINSLRDLHQLYTYGTNLSFTCNALGNICLLGFIKVTFFEKNPKPSFYLIFFSELAVGPFLFLGQFLEFETIYFFLLHVLMSFLIYSIMTRQAFQLRTKLLINEPNEKVPIGSLFYIGLSGILLFIAVAMFIVHEVILMLEIFSEYLTVALGWVLGSVAAYIIYIGYGCPVWAKRRWLEGKL
jgi:hypothetical protein